MEELNTQYPNNPEITGLLARAKDELALKIPEVRRHRIKVTVTLLVLLLVFLGGFFIYQIFNTNNEGPYSNDGPYAPINYNTKLSDVKVGEQVYGFIIVPSHRILAQLQIFSYPNQSGYLKNSSGEIVVNLEFEKNIPTSLLWAKIKMYGSVAEISPNFVEIQVDKYNIVSPCSYTDSDCV